MTLSARYHNDMLLRFRYASFTTALLIFAAGCGLRNPYDTAGQGPLSIPPAGETRIVSRQIGDRTPDSLHWKWSLISGSNWTAATAQGTKLSLVQPYALNDPLKLHGTNVYEYDLTAERSKKSPGAVRWTATLHGSNGSTAHAEGETPLVNDLDSTVRILVDRDTVQSLPADIALAHIGDRDIVISLAAAR